MASARRSHSNFSLQHAAFLAAELGRPLVVVEPLRCDYPWASDRIHRFAIDGMRANAKAFNGRPVLYHPYVEPSAGHGRGLVRALGQHACAIVTDSHPGFFMPRMTAAAARQVDTRLEAVDTNGLIPLSAHGRGFPTARGYRAFVQRTLREHIRLFPAGDPLAGASADTVLPSLPSNITARWPAADSATIAGDASALGRLPIDHSIAPVPAQGGSEAAARTLKAFVEERLPAYGDAHNHPDADGTSRLSPYLHFGHISAHEVFAAVMTRERWTTRRLGPGARGAREGWWGVSPSAESFLDQLVVWRELAYNAAEWVPRYTEYEALPAWARQTLEAHEEDPRSHRYDLDVLDRAETHDEVWNAAQRQLKNEGWFHGYLRMLWGKKILEWSAEPAAALGVMEHLMNRYSLDGRDPVSYASFSWVLGQYDRPWPERPIFGTVRCMTSESAKRKLKMKSYLARYGPQQPEFFLEP
jgi:deoxyribodipyrimidine photo-lyase